MEVVLTLTAHLEDVGDVLCGFDSVFPGADHVNGLRELRPEVRSELLGELRAQPGAELGLSHLPHTGVTPHTARGSGGHLDRAVGLRRLNPGQKVLQLRGRKTIVRVADNREIIIKRKLGSKKTLDS